MKKSYIKPDSRTLVLSTQNHFAHSLVFMQAREERDDRFEDYEDYDEDENDFDNVAFWDD